MVTKAQERIKDEKWRQEIAKRAIGQIQAPLKAGQDVSSQSGNLTIRLGNGGKKTEEAPGAE